MNNLSFGFPDGNLMIQQNSADFARVASATLSDPNSSSWEIDDAKQWMGANPTYANTSSVSTDSQTAITNAINSLINNGQGGISNQISNDNSGSSSSSSSFWNGLWEPIQKYADAGIAIVVGLILIAGAIYIYHE